MTKEEIEVVQLCYDHLDKFTDIYPKDKNADGLRWENKMPENVKLTVYCKGPINMDIVDHNETTDANWIDIHEISNYEFTFNHDIRITKHFENEKY